MKRSIVGFSVMVLSLLGCAAQAAPIFSYTVTPTPTSFSGLSAGNSVTLAGGSGSGLDGGFPGGTNINVLTVNIAAAAGSTVDTVTNQSASFALKITDQSNVSGTVTFTGIWNGSLGNGNSSMTLTNFMPASPVNLQLDGSLYTVTFMTPNLNSVGTNTFAVKVQATSIVPEPSSIVVIAVTMVGGLIGTRRFLRRA
jgi:hypothetical protein